MWQFIIIFCLILSHSIESTARSKLSILEAKRKKKEEISLKILPFGFNQDVKRDINTEMVFYDYSERYKSMMKDHKKKKNNKIKISEKIVKNKNIRKGKLSITNLTHLNSERSYLFSDNPLLQVHLQRNKKSKDIEKEINNFVNFKSDIIPEYVDYTSIIKSMYKRRSSPSFEISSSTYRNGKEKKINYFILRPAYNMQKYIESENGVASVSIKEKDSNFLFNAIITSKDTVNTSISFKVERNEKLEIPLFHIYELELILEKYKINEKTGAYLLVDLSDEIDSTNFVGKYQGKIYLNSNLEMVDEGLSYQYEMYLDLEVGNFELELMDLNGNIGRKIIHIAKDKLIFERSKFVASKFKKIYFFKNGLTMKIKTRYLIDEVIGESFKRKNIFNTIGENVINLKLPLTFNTTRNYLELNKNLMIGFLENRNLVIPNPEYRSYIRSNLNIDKDDGTCIIQVNLEDSYQNAFIDASFLEDGGELNYFFLDKDGSVGKEISVITDSVVITSEDEGAIYLKLSREGKNEYLRTYCARALYLVEQL